MTMRFNHAALRDILTDLEVPFEDGYHTLRTRCFMDRECWQHQGPSLALYCEDVAGSRAGFWKCFRCERRGFIDTLVAALTNRDWFGVYRYLAAHQAYDDPDDTVQRTYATLSDGELARFNYRHQYVYDRKLEEATAVRYGIGFDHETWMITIPVYDATTTLVAIKKRSITRKIHQLCPTLNYHPTFFGIHLVKPASVLWLCEGEFDAMFLDQCLRECGLPHAAISLAGKELSQRALPEIVGKAPVLFVDALDNDKEGRKASVQLRAHLQSLAPSVRFEYEDGVKDPNESSAQHIVMQAYRIHRHLTTKEQP